MADAMNTRGAVALHRPARIAAARTSRAGLLLGTLGLGASSFVVVRMFETWRVAPPSSSHRFSILGLALTYPAANAQAIVILALAIVGFVVIATAVVAAGRELVGSARLVRRLNGASSDRLKGALVIEDAVPRAFCAGLLRPRIYISRGALTRLDEPALDAVLAHERRHAERRDPLRFATLRVMARALSWLPAMSKLADRQTSLAELGADEHAVEAAGGDRSPLARAMLAFGEAGSNAQVVAIDPVRADYLLGQPPSWRLPVVLCLAAGAVLALIAALATFAGRVATGTATLALPVVSRAPCVAVLAMIPVAIGLLRAYWAVSEAA